MKLEKLLKLLVCITGTALLIGCSTCSKYGGDPVLYTQYVSTAGVITRIIEIDGKNIKSDKKCLKLSPGRHILTIVTEPARGCPPNVAYPMTISIDFVSGNTYMVDALGRQERTYTRSTPYQSGRWVRRSN